jgi:hypothetical protein
MHEVLIGKNADIKKWTKKDPQRGTNNLKEAILESSGCAEWTRSEVAANNVELLGSFNPVSLLSEALVEKLEEKNIESIDDYQGKDFYWFVVTDVKPKVTKNKKPYLLLTVSGASGGNTRLFCWGWNGEKEVPKYAICIAEIDKNDFGCSTKMFRLKILNS